MEGNIRMSGTESFKNELRQVFFRNGVDIVDTSLVHGGGLDYFLRSLPALHMTDSVTKKLLFLHKQNF